MKSIKFYLISWPLVLLLNSCGPEKGDCDVVTAIVDNLVSLTPIQSQFSVGDTLTISCAIPNQNNFFISNTNILMATGNNRMIYTLVEQSELIGNQQLILRKGDLDGPYYVAVYNAACDCYEFEAALILSEIKSYSIFLGNDFDIRDSSCDGFTIDSSFPWVNRPNLLEFEVVP